jgi:glucokinase
MSENRLYAGIDLGGTKILTLIADANGNVLGQARLATEAARGPDAVIGRIIESCVEAARDAGVTVREIAGSGVAAPGPIDRDEGIITDPPNLPGWHNVPLARLLSERFGVPTVLENDANCGAIGEHAFGAGRGYRDMIYVTISTGVGGGIIIDNKLYPGASGAAGEVGHIGVTPDGPTCGAGHVGCLEAYSSGTAIANRAREMIEAGGLPRTARIAEAHPPISADDVYMAAQQGEAEAGAIITSAGRYLGMGLASIINAFNPQAIVIGGGLVNMGEAILSPALEVARQRSFAQSFADVQIVEWTLGERGTAMGALASARNREEVASG